MIQSTTAAEPLVQAVYEEVLRAGGLPIVQLSPEGAQAAFYELASDEQLDWVPPTAEWAVENADVRIAIMADANTRELSQVDPKKQARAQKARKPLMETSMRRSGRRRLPLGAHALPDPRLRERGGHVAVRLRGLLLRRLPGDGRRSASPPGSASRTRSSGSPTGSRARRRSTSRRPAPTSRSAWRAARWIPCVGEHNMPDGEFFTGPVEDSVNGEVAFSFPASYGGREVSGVQLRFEDGKVVDASAERGEDFLIEMLDTDDGARRLGELGIGTNYGITTGTKEILLDEKIGGTRPHGDRHELPGDAAARTAPRSTGTWSATCAGRNDHGGRGGAAGERAVRSRLTGYACATYVHNFPRRTEVSNSSADNGPRPSMSKMRNPSDSRVL